MRHAAAKLQRDARTGNEKIAKRFLGFPQIRTAAMRSSSAWLARVTFRRVPCPWRIGSPLGSFVLAQLRRAMPVTSQSTWNAGGAHVFAFVDGHANPPFTSPHPTPPPLCRLIHVAPQKPSPTVWTAMSAVKANRRRRCWTSRGTGCPSSWWSHFTSPVRATILDGVVERRGDFRAALGVGVQDARLRPHHELGGPGSDVVFHSWMSAGASVINRRALRPQGCR